jgi:hypothetical protein
MRMPETLGALLARLEVELPAAVTSGDTERMDALLRIKSRQHTEMLALLKEYSGENSALEVELSRLKVQISELNDRYLVSISRLHESHLAEISQNLG